MSLKAKIEAVIYASEEPVTLAQLAGLLGQEAQAELDRADSAQQTLSLDAAEGAADATDATDVPDGEASVPQGAAEDAAERHEVVPAPDAVASVREEKARTGRLRMHFRTVLDELIAEYASPARGLEIREVAGGFRFGTKPEYHDAVRGFVKSLKPPLKLSLQALETLAVVAYKQPVTAPEISEIRGVDSGGVLGSLMARKLITTAGRKQVIGRPILYKTTRDFLLKFGLKDTAELPSIEEFEKMAGQMAEQEEIPMEHTAPESPQELEPENESHAAHADGDSTLGEETGAEADKASVDGRLSGLPPDYSEDDADDPSARESRGDAGSETARDVPYATYFRLRSHGEYCSRSRRSAGPRHSRHPGRR